MSIDMPKGELFGTEDTVFTIGLPESQLNGGKEWIKNHKDTEVMDTPLWVLISLGVLAMKEVQDDS